MCFHNSLSKKAQEVANRFNAQSEINFEPIFKFKESKLEVLVPLSESTVYISILDKSGNVLFEEKNENQCRVYAYILGKRPNNKSTTCSTSGCKY